MSPSTSRPTRLTRFLGLIERGGNALPHPATLFALLALLVVIISGIAARFDLTVMHPRTHQPIQPVSLLSVAGLHRMMTEMVTNFSGFAPLGTVLVAMLGIAVAEGSGLIGAGLKLVVLSAPARLLTAATVFAGVMSNTGGEVGYVLLIPLAAIMFHAVGRNPLAGLAAAFAGVSGGYSANLLLGTVDPLLAGLSTEAARIVRPGYEVNPSSNYYFMAASTFLITALGTVVTEKIVEPRLGPFEGERHTDGGATSLSDPEKRGLWWAAGAALALTAVALWGLVPAGGFLRDPQTGGVLRSPFITGIVAVIFAAGVILGLAYGFGARTIRSDGDVVRAMAKSMETLGVYLVIVFFAAQFVAYFNWTQLGLIMAIKGAAFLQAANLGPIPLLVTFVLVSAVINLFMGSASAKWAIMAPVFVPMFMLLGYTPEFTQAAFRIGDSTTNIITPMMTYYALIIAFTQRYRPDAGIGTLVAMMLPYSVVFLIGWTLMLVVWIALGLPVGPGAPLYLSELGM